MALLYLVWESSVTAFQVGVEMGIGLLWLNPRAIKHTLDSHQLTWWNIQLSIKLGKQGWAGAQHRIWPHAASLAPTTTPVQYTLLGATTCMTVNLHSAWVYQCRSRSTITQTLSKHSCTAVDPADSSLKGKHPGHAQELIQAKSVFHGPCSPNTTITGDHIFPLPLVWLD